MRDSFEDMLKKEKKLRNLMIEGGSIKVFQDKKGVRGKYLHIAVD
jgi:hypothetical protein